jgi:hypothetical protein
LSEDLFELIPWTARDANFNTGGILDNFDQPNYIVWFPFALIEAIDEKTHSKLEMTKLGSYALKHCQQLLDNGRREISLLAGICYILRPVNWRCFGYQVKTLSQNLKEDRSQQTLL